LIFELSDHLKTGWFYFFKKGVKNMKKTRKTNETGRSMVEMLGVLAIVGVLSVGGVYGYGVAMKKHKANEALHKASLMATTVSAYAMSNDGDLPSTITDFTNSGYATTLSDNGTQFNLTVKGIGFDVCTQMQNVKGGMVRDVTCNETTGDATITYYKNLATTQAEGEKSPTGDTTEPVDPACEGVKCEEGLTCFHGQCKCPNGVFMCGTQCCSEGTYCSQGDSSSTYACATPTGDCTQNSDCDESEYCKFSSGDCYGPTGGVCTDKEPLTPYTLNLPNGNLTVYMGEKMDYWSAKNLCEANKKQLLTMDDLGISDQSGQRFCYFDHSETTNENKKCICTSDDPNCTQTATALYAIGKNDAFWLADNANGPSCWQRVIGLDSGDANMTERHYKGIYILCR
jgi:type II secretory pathway pseudopilin PulG